MINEKTKYAFKDALNSISQANYKFWIAAAVLTLEVVAYRINIPTTENSEFLKELSNSPQSCDVFVVNAMRKAGISDEIIGNQYFGYSTTAVNAFRDNFNILSSRVSAEEIKLTEYENFYKYPMEYSELHPELILYFTSILSLIAIILVLPSFKEQGNFKKQKTNLFFICLSLIYVPYTAHAAKTNHYALENLSHGIHAGEYSCNSITSYQLKHSGLPEIKVAEIFNLNSVEQLKSAESKWVNDQEINRKSFYNLTENPYSIRRLTFKMEEFTGYSPAFDIELTAMISVLFFGFISMFNVLKKTTQNKP